MELFSLMSTRIWLCKAFLEENVGSYHRFIYLYIPTAAQLSAAFFLSNRYENHQYTTLRYIYVYLQEQFKNKKRINTK